MIERYIKIDGGEMIPDRRETIMDPQQVQTTLLKILSKVETLEISNLTHLNGLTERINNLDEKTSSSFKLLDDKIVGSLKLLEDRFNDHIKVSDDMNETIGEHQELLNAMSGYEGRIKTLEIISKKNSDKIRELEDALEQHLDQPKTMVFNVLKEIGKKVGWFILTVIATALIFSFLNPEFWKTLIK